jgi:A/G-specific adenine glycosylase
MAPAARRAFRAALLAWYRTARRQLPWRDTRDPYRVWVSEIMLQQTRVETVVPYFGRFLERFPRLDALAKAPLDEVLLGWSGLGYYRRARQLHLAAREVVERYGGALPARAEQLRQLPGIGRYTAGAIASIAFDERVALVDGNVTRVLARFAALDDDMRSARGQAGVWALAEELVPRRDPGDFNQALMELGATVCTPTHPACGSCPLETRCQAARHGRVAELPRLAPKKPPRALACVALVARGRGGRLWLGRRVPEGLFGGLWEPPLVEANDVAGARPLLQSHGLGIRAALEECGQVSHVLSHRRLSVRVVRAAASAVNAPRRPSGPYDLLGWRRLGDVALSRLAQKVLSVTEPS